MRKICVVTGTRAEWGLLSRLARLIQEDKELTLQIVATNMHLSERYGYTYKEIEADGFTIDCKVPMEPQGDGAADTVNAMAVGLSGFAAAFETLRPDILVVLGDRYEILMAVSAALIFKIPVAHLHGGEITEGAFDDSIRHAITKMSHLHFASTEAYRSRIVQMGEQPGSVFNVGAIGVDNIKQIPLWEKEETEKSLGGFALNENTALVTYHPVTLDEQSHIDELLGALDEQKWLRIIFTMPNSDTGSREIAEKIAKWCDQNRDRAVCFTSLGLKRYLSTLQYIGMVIGNSSSGIIEVPSFGIPTLNIGDRQKGRIAAQSVEHCDPIKEKISQKILQLREKKYTFVNPYERPNTAENIFKALKEEEINHIVQKQFYDII